MHRYLRIKYESCKKTVHTLQLGVDAVHHDVDTVFLGEWRVLS